ncbi:hypothetical protein TWF696_005582 [Orbilia brochopaga]|uniref:Uncharacterized protein n=1 Tax=Orbilia brochopaga TaxID=3140254 RepID=A0AAV9V4E1_9PEZI
MSRLSNSHVTESGPSRGNDRERANERLQQENLHGDPGRERHQTQTAPSSFVSFYGSSLLQRSLIQRVRATRLTRPADWEETFARQRLDANPELPDITAGDYITFVDALCEDALWRLESRLIFTKFNHIPRDAYKELIDDQSQGMPWYSFLKDERNSAITKAGRIDIMRNYQKIVIDRPRLTFISDPYENGKSNSKEPTAQSKGKQPTKNTELSAEEAERHVRFDHIGKLLMDAGYKPHGPPKELESDQYPDAAQYYTDLTAFLETILCLLIATCPQVNDYEDIVGLTYVNYDSQIRGLRFENNSLTIASYVPGVGSHYRTAIPAPLSRMILIYLIEIRPFLSTISSKNYEQKHWRPPFLFPCYSGGPWGVEHADRILRREAKAKMRADIGLDDFKAVYHNLKGKIGEGWLREVPYWLKGEEEQRVEIKWSIQCPGPPNHVYPGAEGYAAKHSETSGWLSRG